MSSRRHAGQTVHICARDIVHHDAVGNFCRQIAIFLEKAGFNVRLWAENTNVEEPNKVESRERFTEELQSDDLIFWNYSTEEPEIDTFVNVPNKKIAYFHNITPPELIFADDAAGAERCRVGREQLWKLGAFDLLMANSRVTAEMLLAALSPEDLARHKDSVIVCPPLIGADRWANVDSDELATENPQATLLYVGRLVQHKGVLEILDIVRALGARVPSLKFVSVGGPGGGEYVDTVRARAREIEDALGVRSEFHMGISDSQLKAIYRQATMCIAHSQHEGFCVPALDALAFDKPLFSTFEPAIVEVAGDAALVIPKGDPENAASAMVTFLEDEERQNANAAARRRRYAELRALSDGHLIMDAVERAMGVK